MKRRTDGRPDVLKQALGRWPGILMALGVEERSLSGRHGPCPIPGCGGKDRFRFDDKEGRGTYFCTQCGAGDGIKLVQTIRGVGFKDALKIVEEVIPVAPMVKRAKQRTAKEKGAALRRIWEGAKAIADGGVVDTYLRSRGLLMRSEMLREATLPYYDENLKFIGNFDAMVGRIVDVEGKGVSLHVTYLTKAGAKAGVPAPKKVMQPVRPLMGASVQLQPAGEVLGVCEGIETGLAAMELFDIPVWPAISADGLAAFVWPESVKRLVILGDCDENYAGHKAAYTLAFRAAGKGLRAEVKLPDVPGCDWNDVLRDRMGLQKKAA